MGDFRGVIYISLNKDNLIREKIGIKTKNEVGKFFLTNDILWQNGSPTPLPYD